MTGAPLIDRAVLDDLFEAISADGARSVLDLFVEESRVYLAAIAAGTAPAAGPAPRDEARRAAHALKSGAGQIGAAAMAAAAANVERAVEAGEGSDFAEAVTALRRCAAQTTAALEPYLTRK